MATKPITFTNVQPLPAAQGGITFTNVKPLEPIGKEIGLATGVFSPPMMARDIAIDPKAAQKEGMAEAGIFGGAMAGAAAAPLLAPSASTATVGTGILDASGDEIMKDIITQGPSAAMAFLKHPVVQAALRYAGMGAGFGLMDKFIGRGEP